LVSKQPTSADAPLEYVDDVEPGAARWEDRAEPSYLLMARLADVSMRPAQAVASAA
jgi:hypothetical protein